MNNGTTTEIVRHFIGTEYLGNFVILEKKGPVIIYWSYIV